MTTANIPKNQAHPVCPENAINPAIATDTATPDQPPRLTLVCPFLLIYFHRVMRGLARLRAFPLNYSGGFKNGIF